MFTTLFFKGALVFISHDFVHVDSNYPAFNAKDAMHYAEKYDAVLPTAELVDAIYAAATCKIATPASDPTSAKSVQKHNIAIRKQKAACSDLSIVDGHKKTIVQSLRKDRMALYGWFGKNGKRIQPYSMAHNLDYKDYSQGIRLVYKWAVKDGRVVSIEEVLAQP